MFDERAIFNLDKKGPSVEGPRIADEGLWGQKKK